MIHTATCSWTEKTLIKSGEFYPAKCKTSEQRLRHYAEHFNTVEVDSTYYAIPAMSTAAQWAARTPEGFVFHIKAYGALTGHGASAATLPLAMTQKIDQKAGPGKRLYVTDEGMLRELTQRFMDALIPLREAGKLGHVLYQYPPWFTRKPDAVKTIMRDRALLGAAAMAVEFRHASWLTGSQAGETLAMLRDNAITYVTADEPQYGSLVTVPFVPAVTTNIAYFRYHGRNKANWLKKGIDVSLRYDYLYSDDELRGFVAEAKKADSEGKTVYSMFNNCHGASAVKNAIRMKEMIEEGD